jgi:GTPase SAR1 family protein
LINLLIVIGVAANKCDLYAQEQVSEKEGLEFAKEINAIFKQTSALSNIGIQELFRELGLKYLQNKLQIQPNENTKTKDNKNNGTVKLENKSLKNNKENDKGCCK